MGLRTTVAIVGAGPAGLALGNILLDHGVDCVILERHQRPHIEQRARAGLLEDAIAHGLAEHGLADRLLVSAARHGACEFRFGGRRYTARYGDLAGGRTHYVYPQQDLVKDLVAAFLNKGGHLLFDAQVTAIRHIADRPQLQFQHFGAAGTVQCDLVAGCDGFHGVSRGSVPDGAATVYEYRHRYGWLAILAAAPPSTDKIIYALHPEGFAGHMLRSPEVSRYYLQCPAGDQVANWPDGLVWEQLRHRLATSDGWALRDGPIIEKSVLDMRSWVCEPMQFGNLCLVGDAAHILTPAGAKGMNLALGNAHELALGLVDHFKRGDSRRLRAYSETRLPAVWRAQEFSASFLGLLHGTVDPGQSRPFADRLRHSALEQISGTTARARSFAESYVG